MTQTNRLIILILSLLSSALIIAVSLNGILDPNLYSKETSNWKTQSIGQDKIDLFIVSPLLLISAFLAYKNVKNTILLWVGIMMYLVYTFIIYAFAVHFNSLYPFYCLILGCCFYSLIYFLIHKPTFVMTVTQKKNNWINITVAYFLIISTMFYALWLKEVLPSARNNSLPSSLIETGLVVNPVHSLDLAFLLPGLFITGIFLVKRNSIAIMMTPAFLTFLMLMNITIAFLSLELGTKNGDVLALIMVLLAGLSLILLAYFVKKVDIKRI